MKQNWTRACSKYKIKINLHRNNGNGQFKNWEAVDIKNVSLV